jgi:protein-disulfide isomerase
MKSFSAVGSLVVLFGAASLVAQTLPQVTAPSPGLKKQDFFVREHEPACAGAAKPDVTILEYFDYNCPYCKKLGPVLKALLAQDQRIAIVCKEWPIFGAVSVYAAKSALAARWQGKYLIAHDALLNGPELTKNQDVDQALARAGIDVVRLKEDSVSHAGDIEASLAHNDAEAHALNLRGTPGVVLGRKVLPGTIDLDGLKRSIAEARR